MPRYPQAPRLLLDVDCVLANLLGPLLREVERLGGPSWAPEEFPTWEIFDTLDTKYRPAIHELWATKGFCRSLEPYPGAVEAVAHLREVSDVLCVTAAVVGSEYWHKERVDWLQEHFDIPHRDVIFAYRKELVQGEVFVEDKTSTLFEWAARNPGGQGILWEWKYNAESALPPGVIRTNSWDKVAELVQGFIR